MLALAGPARPALPLPRPGAGRVRRPGRASCVVGAVRRPGASSRASPTALDVVTYEFENVPVEAARRRSRSAPVYPPPRALEVGQDRLAEKSSSPGSASRRAFAAVDARASSTSVAASACPPCSRRAGSATTARASASSERVEPRLRRRTRCRRLESSSLRARAVDRRRPRAAAARRASTRSSRTSTATGSCACHRAPASRSDHRARRRRS